MFGIPADGNLSLLKGGEAVAKPSLREYPGFGVETQNHYTLTSLMPVFFAEVHTHFIAHSLVYFLSIFTAGRLIQFPRYLHLCFLPQP